MDEPLSTDEQTSMNELLNINSISVQFDGLLALQDVTFNINTKEIVSLIGPNGAGKTTLLNCLSCLQTPTQGDITYKGISLAAKAPHHLAALGINRTFQRVALFQGMTVLDNIKLGLHSHSHGGFISSAFRLPFIAREEQRLHQVAMALLVEFQLEKWVNTPLINIPMVIQKRIELARAIIGTPQLLLLDEPASGLSHHEVEEQKNLILNLRDKLGITLLIVEHNMGFVMDLSDRIVVLDFGQKIAEGTPEDIKNNPEVIRAYLGLGEGE